ncbi:MAG TPA: hypothetical protein VLN26_01495, partial [Gaiellaceae bacterium]|nr:hypothetical protein [Gaiellaceae bacterium]
MHVSPETVAAIVFAVAIVVAAAALYAAALERVRQRVLVALVFVTGAAAAADWVLFGLHPQTPFAVRAGATTGAVLVVVGASALRRALERVRRIDLELERSKAELDAVVAREVEIRAAELEHTLARSRADSISMLVEEERRIAEERRREVAERERT